VVVKAATFKEVVLHHTLSQQVEDNHKCDYEQELYHFTPVSYHRGCTPLKAGENHGWYSRQLVGFLSDLLGDNFVLREHVESPSALVRANPTVVV
jgi:hypothetical protein